MENILLTHFLDNVVLKSHFVAEIVGTAILVILGDGVVACVLLKKSKGENSGWIVITAGWGLAVAMGVYVTAWVSGAHLNPAVTLGFFSIGKISISESLTYIAGQLIGALIGALFVWLAYKPHWEQTDNADNKLLVFCTMPAIRKYWFNLLTEIIGTAILLIGVLGIVNKHNSLAGGIAPLAIGFLVWAIGLSLGGPTGYAINPARDFCPRIMHAILPIPGKRNSDWAYSWVPIVGPIIGGVTGSVLYRYVFLSYWTAA